MKNLSILLVGAFVISLVGGVSAYEGFPTWYLNEITAANPITIDGSLADWAWVDPSTIITSDDLQDMLGEEKPTKDDWDCELIGGWSASENMIYFGAKVLDDIFNNDCPYSGATWNDDSVHIVVDANNDGGNYRDEVNGGPAQMLSFHIPNSRLTQVTYHFTPEEEMQWIVQEPLMVTAYDDSNVPNVAIYEWKMAIWDRVDPTGAENSERHICSANETIGLQIEFNDVDDEFDQRDNWLGTGTGLSGSSWRDASVISNFVLLPALNPGIERWSVEEDHTAVRAVEWGWLKGQMELLKD